MKTRLPALLGLASACLIVACSGSGSSGSPTTSAAASQAASPAASASPSSSAMASSSAAASSDASSAPSSATASGATASGATASGAASSGAPGASGGTATALDITAKDFAFDLPPSVQAGATAINLKNTGAEEHQAQLVKLQTGKSITDLLAALQKPDQSETLKIVTLAGGPAGVAPGATGSTTVNLDAGQYAFICFVQGADGIPHFAKGMVAPLEVTGTAASTDLPKGDADLNVKDFSFDLSSLTAGKHTLNVDNQGPQPHEAQIVKLAEGMTVDKVRQMLTASPPPSGAPQQGPPFTTVGGLSAIAPGAKATVDVDLQAGNYAFICFVPDPASGKSHFELGMFTPLTVQ